MDHSIGSSRTEKKKKKNSRTALILIWNGVSGFLFEQTLGTINYLHEDKRSMLIWIILKVWLYPRLMFEEEHPCAHTQRFKPQETADGVRTHCLFWQKSDKTSETFNWAIQHSEAKIREGEDSRMKREREREKNTHTHTHREKLCELTAAVYLTMALAKVWVSSDLLPAGHLLFRLCLFLPPLIWLQTLEGLSTSSKLSKYPRNQTPSRTAGIKDPQVNQTKTQTQTTSTWKGRGLLF